MGAKGVWRAVDIARSADVTPVIMDFMDGYLMRFGFLTEADAVHFGVSNADR